LVHRIQNLRRAAGFEITDRINTYYQGPQRIAEVMGGEHAGYIQQETLSDELVDGEAAEGAHAEHQKLDGMELDLAVRRVDAGG
jgi:isoleucyl-tRNA synthetase